MVANLTSVHQLLLLCVLCDDTFKEHRFSIPMIDDVMHKCRNALKMSVYEKLAQEWLDYTYDSKWAKATSYCGDRWAPWKTSIEDMPTPELLHMALAKNRRVAYLCITGSAISQLWAKDPDYQHMQSPPPSPRDEMQVGSGASLVVTRPTTVSAVDEQLMAIKRDMQTPDNLDDRELTRETVRT